MIEDRKLKLVIKNHDCVRVGELVSFRSFDAESVVNDVGGAVLVAGYDGYNDTVLDSLDTADMILEAYAQPAGHDRFLDKPIWEGFLRNRRLEQDGPAKIGTYLFQDFNDLLKRRRVIPPEGASHDEHYGTVSNVMRELVRTHAAEYAEEARRFPGLSVEGDVSEDTGLYGDVSAMVFGSGMPEWVRVNCLYVWDGWMYAGTETQSAGGAYAYIYRSDDGATWTEVFDGSMGVYAHGVTGIHCFCEFDGELWAGCSQEWESENAIVLHSTDGETWTRGHEFPNDAGIWSLCEFDGYLYAGTTGYTGYGSLTYLWRSLDGEAWTAVLSTAATSGPCPPVGFPLTYDGSVMRCNAIHQYGANLFIGTFYQHTILMGYYTIACKVTTNWARGQVYYSSDGTGFTLVKQFIENTPYPGRARPVISFGEFGGKFYVGTGDTRSDYPLCSAWPCYKPSGGMITSFSGLGEIWELGTWTQVFGSEVDDSQVSTAITSFMQTTDYNGNPCLWASSYGGKIYQSSPDGTTWTLVVSLNVINYRYALALAAFIGNRYVSTGTNASADKGDIWRVVPTSVEVEDAAVVGRWVTLLEKLQELSEQAGNVDFGIIGFDSFLYCPQSFQFQVRTPQWGTDNRWDGERGVSFALARGNMAAPMYEEVRGSRPNYVYVLGPSADEDREIDEFVSWTSVSESPWNRVEGVADAQSVDSFVARSNVGLAALKADGPYTDLGFEVLETNTCHYIAENEDGEHPSAWRLGDIVSGYYSGKTVECKIEKVSIHAAEGDPAYTVRTTFGVLSVESETVPGEGVVAGGEGSAVLWKTLDGTDWGQVLSISGENAATCLVEAENLLAGTDGSAEFWMSSNSGENWEQVDTAAERSTVHAMALASNGNVVAAVDNEFWLSTNGRDFGYISVATGEEAVLCFVLAEDGHLYAGTYDFGGELGDLYKSIDNGASWSVVTAMGLAVTALSAAGGNLQAALHGGALGYSANGGIDWTYNSAAGGDSLCMLTLSTGEVWAGVSDGTIWESADYGVNWVEVYDLGASVNGLTELESGVIFAAAGNTIQRWDGADWTEVQGDTGVEFRCVLGI